jgi:uncharacterized membrane protein
MAKQQELDKGEIWFAVGMIILIFTLTIGATLLANCMLLDEVCS